MTETETHRQPWLTEANAERKSYLKVSFYLSLKRQQHFPFWQRVGFYAIPVYHFLVAIWLYTRAVLEIFEFGIFDRRIDPKR